MIKIIGICGSPRKGNTEWMIQKALEGAKQAGAETELILLREKRIEMCKGICSDNCIKNQKCVIKDDMTQIYDKLLKADGIIIGAPTYFGLPPGILKNFMDRTSPIYRKLDNKVGGVLTVGMSESNFGGIELSAQAIRIFLLWHNMTVVGGPVCAKAEKPNEIETDKKVEKECMELGKKIVNVCKMEV